MGLTEKLIQIKSETDALLEYANQATNAGDTKLGDAIRTLADGFGKGGTWELHEAIHLKEYFSDIMDGESVVVTSTSQTLVTSAQFTHKLATNIML